MKFNFLLLSCFLVVKIGANEVLVFTDNDFNKNINEHDIVLVKFFSPWCGHCETLAPEFEKAAEILKSNAPPITLAEVDCTSNGKLTCKMFGVKGYPTLKVFMNGELSFNYDGPKHSGGIVEYMKSKLSLSLREIKSPEEFDKCLKEIDNVVMGFFDTPDSDVEKVFQKLSRSLQDSYRFAYTYSNKLMTKYGYRNEIALFRSEKLQTKMEPNQVKFEGKPTLYELRTWVTNKYHGFVGYRTQKNKEQFEVPFVVVYCDIEFNGKPTDTRYWRNGVMNVARKYTQGTRKVTFVISDAKEFQQELRDFDLDPLAEKPLVAARDSSQQKYALREDFSMVALEKFVEELLDGSLNPYSNSASVPLTENGLVKVVGRINFNEIVNDPTKDVLLLLVAPWCTVCHTVAKTLEEVAQKLESESHIVLAKMDITTDDLPRPYYMKGYPSLYFSPQHNKSEPKLYKGGFSAKDFIRFLAAETTVPLVNYDKSGRRVTEEVPHSTGEEIKESVAETVVPDVKASVPAEMDEEAEKLAEAKETKPEKTEL